jgi:hypothetical protein
MKDIRWILLVATMTASYGAFLNAEDVWGQADLEDWLDGIIIPDYYPDGEPAYVPYRYRDSLPEFQEFFVKSGWTTNQFIEGLIFAATNNMTDANWADEARRRVAKRAIWKLGEINKPAVTNFFRYLNDNADLNCKATAIPQMFHYTNLEPEVLEYMRSMCARTNLYDRVALRVFFTMFETLSTMPDAMKPAATNRVAQYMYFAIHHVTDSQGWQDIELSRFIPAYSNSIQRLRLMQYVANSATNAWERSNAASVVQALSAIPTNQLNDVSWITE